MRVLVVDDEPQILRALRVVLREAGYEAIPAETAEEALDRAAIRPPDAAIVPIEAWLRDDDASPAGVRHTVLRSNGCDKRLVPERIAARALPNRLGLG